MRAFDVRLKGKRLCVARIGEDGVLTAIVDHVAGYGHNRLHLRVGGLICPQNAHVTWRSTDLKIGDEVTVCIIEAESVDRPWRRKRRDPGKEQRQLKQYVRRMAKKFGWKIVR